MILLGCFRGYDQDEDDASDRLICVQYLYTAASDINYMKPGTKMTPLHWAAYNHDVEVVTFLLEKGGHLYMNGEGLTPIDLAGMVEELETVDEFLNYFKG